MLGTSKVVKNSHKKLELSEHVGDPESCHESPKKV